MAFTYVGDMSSTREILRFMIQDTESAVAAKQIFTDAELDGLIATYGSDINRLAGFCMMAVASSASRIATVCTIGGRDFSNDRKQVAKECREQAQVFFKLSNETPYATEIALEDPDITRINDYEDSGISDELSVDDLNS